ncbi:MAG: DNA polymerase IV [archaeon]
MPLPSRIIGHVDMDAFFASVERMDHPEWRDDPIIVCVYSGRTPDSGVVSSASYTARQLGIKAGMPIAGAQSLCPAGHFVPVHHERYSSLSGDIFSKLVGVGSIVEVASIDEAYVDLSSRVHGSWAEAEGTMRDFQSLIQKEFSLSCSVGLGPSKLVAKIASDFKKPGGFTSVPPEEVPRFLDPLPVKCLMGVGPKTEEELASHSIRTVAELRTTGLDVLVSSFGSAKGQHLFFSSRGMDDSPVIAHREPKQHSRIWTLAQDAGSYDPVSLGVYSNADALWEESAGNGQFFNQVGVVGISSRMGQSSKTKSLSLPCSSPEQFRAELDELFRLLFESADLPLRRIGIRVGSFSSAIKQRRLSDFLG